jgi:hypothetical protein
MVALIAGKLYSFFSLLYRLRSAVMRCPAHVSRPIAGPHEEQRSQQGNDGASEHTRARQNRSEVRPIYSTVLCPFSASPSKLSHHAPPNRRDSSITGQP